HSNGLVQALAFSPDGRSLAAADGSRVQLWNVATNRPRGPPLPGRAVGVAFSPDGRMLAVDAGAGRVRLWDPATRASLGTLPGGGDDEAPDLSFSPDGRELAVGAGIRTTVWDVRRRSRVGDLPGGGAAFSGDGRTIVTS